MKWFAEHGVADVDVEQRSAEMDQSHARWAEPSVRSELRRRTRRTAFWVSHWLGPHERPDVG